MVATYKGSLKLEKVNSGEFALDQNPDSGSMFAAAARQGHKVQWVLAYQGDVILDGQRMSKSQAAAVLSGSQAKEQPKAQNREFPGWGTAQVAADTPKRFLTQGAGK